MRNKHLAAYRDRVVPAATGRVLEVGIGSGLNLPRYSPHVQQVIGLEPSPKLLSMAQHIGRQSFPVGLIEGSAEDIPLEDATVDTVVTTWTLCTIPDAGRALSEMRRVLKPGGRLLFVEHGRAPDPNVVWWQDRLTPMWKRLGGGCHLNRAIETLIQGLRISVRTIGHRLHARSKADDVYVRGQRAAAMSRERVVEGNMDWLLR
jgi:ubiquinone/menaquinone biosynthesis C-methylase UbiE